MQFRAHWILPNWSQVKQSGTAGHFTNKLPYILKCKKQENLKWEETAKGSKAGSESKDWVTNNTQPPTLRKPKNKTLTNLCIPTCHLSSPIETLESPLVKSFQLHIIPKLMRGQLYLKYCHAELCTFQLKAKLQSKFLPSYNHLSKTLFKKAGTWELGRKLAPHTHLPTA